MTVVDWLLDSDSSVRWQAMRELTDALAEEVAAERARVATEGAGARLLALQAADGRWGGAAWNRGWDSMLADGPVDLVERPVIYRVDATVHHVRHVSVPSAYPSITVNGLRRPGTGESAAGASEDNSAT